MKFVNLTEHISPCQTIENLFFAYEQSETANIPPPFHEIKTTKNIFVVSLIFLSANYKEITHVQAFDAQSLVGNSEGYLGLFLGYALLQIPEFLTTAYDWIKHKYYRLGE